MQTIRIPFRLAFIAVVPVLACSRGEPRTAYAGSAPSTKVAAVPAANSATAAALRFVLSPTGNAARYRVRERLVGHDLPNDAIGETKALTGAIEFDSKGNVIPQSSKFVVDAGTFVSDKDRRDGFVRGRLLDAEQYPSIVLVPTVVRGVGLPLPTSGTLQIEMTGDLTVHGVTRPTIWKGSARFQDGRVTGSAATVFTFNDIQMEQPRVPVLLSVADTIRLEIDFDLIRQR
ncbi:MAG TPA: YceI family protein [Gemmatimonadaceae bacterium]|nr:YceI family protein [Gemmatimonadaceae bacterium]